MKKKVRKLVLSKETVLALEKTRVSGALGGGVRAGDSLTNCMALSCIGYLCAETDPPCFPETA